MSDAVPALAIDVDNLRLNSLVLHFPVTVLRPRWDLVALCGDTKTGSPCSAGTTEISDDQARILREGMEVLVGYLASVRDGWEDEDAPIH